MATTKGVGGTQQEITLGKDVKKSELLCTVGGSAKRYNHYRIQCEGSSKTEKGMITHTSESEAHLAIFKHQQQHVLGGSWQSTGAKGKVCEGGTAHLPRAEDSVGPPKARWRGCWLQREGWWIYSVHWADWPKTTETSFSAVASTYIWSKEKNCL